MPSCELCGLPTPDPPLTDPEVEGSYCCRGCLEVQRRLEQRAGDAPGEERDTDDEVDEPETVYLGVEGMHCTACETYLEQKARDQEGVVGASARYGPGMLRLRVNPDQTDPDHLIEAVQGMGYRLHRLDRPENSASREDLGRLWVGGFFAMMIMVWYGLFLYPSYLGFSDGSLLLDPSGSAGDYLLWNLAVMAGVVLLYGGYPILRNGYVSLESGRPNMDLLISLAAVNAYLFSLILLLTGSREVYFDVSTVIVFAVTLGRYWKDRVRNRTAGLLRRVTRDRVRRARRRTPGGTEMVPREQLQEGDRIVVHPGERIPVDATVVEGDAQVDESLMTGESSPVRKTTGDEVIGGSVVADAPLEAVVDDTRSTYERLLERMWAIQSSRTSLQRMADRLAGVFVPLVLLLAVAAAGWWWYAGGGPTEALLTGFAVLVVSCPCALGLATPLAVASVLRRALKDRILIQSTAVFEQRDPIRTVVFDKTGTLTEGRMEVVGWKGDRRGLRRASQVEQHANHPVAEAITRAQEPEGGKVSEYRRYPGRGVGGMLEDREVLVGSIDLFEERQWDCPTDLRRELRRLEDRGTTAVLVGWDKRVRTVITLRDRPRTHWRRAVEKLADRVEEIVVLTGDRSSSARLFEQHPDVDRVHTNTRPERKAEIVGRLRQNGPVAMVGDGSNDSSALALADLGIAMGSGTAMASDAADAVMTSNDLGRVSEVFALRTTAYRRIRQNLGWAFLYNGIAIPLAVAGQFNPLLAALAMATSSVVVVGNSMRPARGPGTPPGEQRTNLDGRTAKLNGQQP